MDISNIVLLYIIIIFIIIIIKFYNNEQTNMNFLYNRCEYFYYILNDNVDKNKLIKSIKLLNKKIKIIKITKEKILESSMDKNIYIIIKYNNFIVNFSHLFYDAYSINLILKKIDEIYKMNDISKYNIKNNEFKFYNLDYSLLNYLSNNIKLFCKADYKNIYNILVKKKNKKKIKILKNNFKNVTTSEIIYYIINKLNIQEYCLLVNARKIYPKYNNYLGNFIYFSDIIKKEDEIRTILEKDNNISLEKLLNTLPKTLMINSYLNFLLPSFIKSFTIDISSIGNLIFIYPLNMDDKYIIIDYFC